MNITVTDQEQCKKLVRLAIPSEAVRAETDKVVVNLARQVNVPGFRRGHVPGSVIRTRFRKELREEVISHLLPNALGDAIREKALRVVGEPSLEDFKFNDDESIDASFTVEVAPEFEIANYKSIALRKRVYKIRDEDVVTAIDHLREGFAELVPVEDRGAQTGDLLTLNVKGVVAEKTPESPVSEEAPPAESLDINQEDLEIELGGRGVLTEFNEALSGSTVGDVRTFVVAYPADYKPEKYAGRTFNLTAEVTAVRAKELPEVDDALASSVNETFGTIDDLRADIRSKFEHEASHKTEEELRSAAIEQLVDRNRFEVPQYIVEKQMDSRINSLVRQFASQGIDPRQLKIDWEAAREGQRERAEREVRGSFVLDRIAELEHIEVSEAEIDSEVEQFAARTRQTMEALKARLTKEKALDSIKEQIRNRKALDFVISSAEIRTEEIEGLGAEEAAVSGDEGQAS
ncbi:MAG TPA: trigger factor [Blastocatellia bacterium]|nr:trigger factor [Blastocatellia bacterium]